MEKFCQVELAYLAGFFDGEGTVNITMTKSSSYGIRAKVAVYNTQSNILLAYLPIFGGSVYHLMDKRPTNKPHIGMWQCHSSGVIEFCEVMLKFSRETEKIKKMKLIIEYSPWIFRNDEGKVAYGKLDEETKQKRMECKHLYDQITADARTQNVAKGIEKRKGTP